MPNIRVHSSGGIVFIPTKEEKQLNDLKLQYATELENIAGIKSELDKKLELLNEKLKQIEGN